MPLFGVISDFLLAYYYTLEVIAVIDTSGNFLLATRSHDVTVTVTAYYTCI